jgi:mycothiol synthase
MSTMKPQTTIAPPAGYTMRPAGWDDLAGITELFRQADLVDWGSVDVTEMVIRHDWEDPNLDLARDTWLVLEQAPADRSATIPVAYASLLAVDSHRQLQAWGVVHPSHRGRGLGSYLMDLMAVRGAEHVPLAPPDGEVVLRPGVIGPDEPAHRLVEARGFRPVRHFWHMERDLIGELAGPQKIPGIQLRTFAYGQDDRAMHAAVQESFADHWGFVQRGFDEWAEHRFHESAFDPDLWFLAEDGSEVAGFLMGVKEEGKIWVGMLGVRPGWRRRGIGEALLRHAFVEFRRLGYPEVALAVDAGNETGATALYERVGMRATRQFDIYERRLR